jgi:methylenetetrahydrofolate dehydrogenase (NADP+)/methenyltetrahydrofolate cyclohydrolase
MAERMDGKEVARRVRAEVAERAAALRARGIVPGLAVVLVGDDPASHVYVGRKEKAAAKAGIAGATHRLPAEVSTADVLATVEALNGDPAVHAILVQLPLPSQVDTEAVLDAVAPAKDVDGFHAVNAGRLASGIDAIAPCTPAGIMRMLREHGVECSGKDAVIIGRSRIVGRPMAALLTNAHATVTICHSRTADLAAHARRADILVVAVGRPEMVTGDWVKPGAVVIDVGINRTESGGLVGDVDYESVCEVASLVTPVPGGVGPMTIATLLANTCRLAEGGG